MSLDVWIYAIPAEFEALGPATEDDPPFSYAHSQAKTGHWKTYAGGFEVFNVVGSSTDIQAIVDALPTSPPHVYAWGQGQGTDDLDTWPTDPADVLAVMRDHITYDENGDVISTTPATLENPNWGHIFLGQQERIFAGEFTDDFSEEFL
jgi:hypothetical protein